MEDLGWEALRWLCSLKTLTGVLTNTVCRQLANCAFSCEFWPQHTQLARPSSGLVLHTPLLLQITPADNNAQC